MLVERIHCHKMYCILIFTLIAIATPEKINLETLNNYSEFLNFGEKKLKLNQNNLENDIIKSKLDVLGEVFKLNIDLVKASSKLDLIFLIDSSWSVGEVNFKSELKFVKKLLSDVTVDVNHTRVAVVTFGTIVNKTIDGISNPKTENDKCLLLNRQLSQISYSGGDTNTLAAFKTANEIFKNSRNDSNKILFLITDGFSNGGDPVPLAAELKNKLITIFTIGIANGNYKELYQLASSPGEQYSYLLDSFEEFENLARRALHVDLKSGDYIQLGINRPCDSLCPEGNCCDENAFCSCGTSSGHYTCICERGYYGTGLKESCFSCPRGSYFNSTNLCLPCPDLQHTTTPPAIGIESCKCKTGYQATKENQCEIVKCPKIATPDHGYFVKKRDCGNVVNSACGIRCEVGYTLVGTSIRLCQSDALWSGSKPSCQIKTCARPAALPFGSMSCSHADLGISYSEEEKALPVDTICTFKCNDGKALIGSSQRTCLPLAQWDGLKAACKQIKCPKLVPIQYGKFEPNSCTIGKQPYGKECKVVCNNGYKLHGPSKMVCNGKHGSWNHKFESISCQDTIAPNITCPDNITTSTQVGKSFASTFWSHPIVEDNSQLAVNVWMKPSIKNLSDYQFEIGVTKITYFAQDVYQNRAKCSFFVTVQDLERPTIEDCFDLPAFLTTDKTGANITWDDPNIFDNSKIVQVNRSHEFGFFPIGTTIVTYTATDPSGNKNICYINISVEDAECEALPDPIYGRSECSAVESEGMQCIISCEEGYALPLSQPDVFNDSSSVRFSCNHTDPIWYHSDSLQFPDCSVTKVPNSFEQNGTASAELDSCNNTKEIQELENNIKITLKEANCGENCTVATDTTCIEDEGNEEITNIIKREIIYEEVAHRDNHRRGKKKRVNVKFQVKGTYINRARNQPANSTYMIEYAPTKIICPLGFIPRKNRCVLCPKGTFHNYTTNRCQSCTFGYFNDQLGQIQCKACPTYFSTRKLYSKKYEDCNKQCPPGTYARRKIIKATKRHATIERTTLWPYCRSCAYGHYQPSYNQLECISCPQNHTTLTIKSTKLNDCLPTAVELCSIPNICNGGTCTPADTFQYSCSCSPDYIGSHCETKLNVCDSNPCFNSAVCQPVENSTFQCICPAGYTGKLCQEHQIEENCILKCFNFGTCYQNDVNDYYCICPPGFGGDSCEIKLKYCHLNICENSATCSEEENGFVCTCSSGFIGRRCNILPCDYKPCKGGKVCVNLDNKNATRDSYKCLCPEGYEGPLCEQKTNNCIGLPCLNGGTCSSNQTGYACACRKSHRGPNCEFKKRTDYVLHFKKFSTLDYIKLNGFGESLHAITACLWMQTSDNFNYGTLISYATQNYDNAFTITDYTGLVLYVNNRHVITDLLLNDGLWHHMCVSWSGANGEFVVYIDGRVEKRGSGLGSSSVIEGHGNMVLGQEQDVLGGRFSQSESFIGKMAFVDFWSTALSHKEIIRHMNDCRNEVFGDVYSWPEIADHVYGDIEILNSTFCHICEQPKTVFNGIININNNVAFYECYKGYYLSDTSFSKGRNCTKSGHWEGSYEPYCKKIYCGYPGYVRNSIMLGTNFYFLEQVTYKCYDGFNMTGNATITCTENGIWYPNRPACAGPQCKAFKTPAYAKIAIIAENSYLEDATSFEPGTQIKIECIEGELNGDSLISCQEDGTWDFLLPNCIIKEKSTVPTTIIMSSTTLSTVKSQMSCDVEKVPPAPDNGYVVLDSLHSAGNGSAEQVFYTCRIGYKLSGLNYTMCIVDGYWTELNMTCTPISCRRPKFKNMVMQKELTNVKFVYGNMAKFDCVPGYFMTGDSRIQCQQTGRWNIMFAKCDKISCLKPILNTKTSIINGKSYLFEDEITIKCSSGKIYILKCSSTQAWNGEKDETC